jgi:hypothetical protein
MSANNGNYPAKPQGPTMTVIINGEEHQRTIKGYVDGLPYPETFDDEFYHRVISSVVPTIVKSK